MLFPNILKKLLPVLLMLLVTLFGISSFKNISYPLLWNDEGTTAIFGKQVLKHGYPKVHDGKNVLYASHIGMRVGVHKEWDAYLPDPWFKDYWAALGVFFAEMTEDIYGKTALVRLPFALMGFIGTLLMGVSAVNLFPETSHRRTLFLVLFLAFELLSVSLVLHIRDARQYALLIFLVSCLFYLFFNYEFSKRISRPLYMGGTILLLFLLFNTFHPLYFIFLASLLLFKGIRMVQRVGLPGIFASKEDLAPFLAMGISLLTVVFPIKFFRVFEFAGIVSLRNQFTLEDYYENVCFLLEFFAKYEFFYLALAMKGVSLGVWIYWRKNNFPHSLEVRRDASRFLSLFFVVHAVLIARSPYMYERYFIALQPTLVLIFLLDLFIVWEFLENSRLPGLLKNIRRGLPAFLGMVFIASGYGKIVPVKNHVFELFHPYQGPLDFIVPYIQANFEEPENLVIATNYEEHSLMYYLGAKVIVGYVGNNIQKDLMLTPDVIIWRKHWNANAWVLPILLQRGRYEKISFSVLDYPFNNIPELHYRVPHLFRTPITEEESKRLEIYVRRVPIPRAAE